jgi:hypothetical protein
MGRFTKGRSKMVREMGKEFINIVMEINSRGSGRMIKNKWEGTNLVQEISFKANLSRGKCHLV